MGKHSQTVLQKKARKKNLSNIVALACAEQCEYKDGKHDPMWQSYMNTFHCAQTLEQNGKTLSTKYCKNRWCITCNGIRTANYINKYSKTLKAFKEPYFVTLSAPSISKHRIRGEVERYQAVWKKIYYTLKKSAQRAQKEFKGIRKLEITYNIQKDWYHPHYHVIVDGKAEAEKMLQLWLAHNEDAVMGAGNKVVKCYGRFEMELFKYFTKILIKHQGKARIHAPSLHVIFQTLYRKRIYMPFGLERMTEEEEFQIQKTEYPELDEADMLEWEYVLELKDWVSANGELLSGYQPDTWEKEHELLYQKQRDAVCYRVLIPPDKQQLSLDTKNEFSKRNFSDVICSV